MISLWESDMEKPDGILKIMSFCVNFCLTDCLETSTSVKLAAMLVSIDFCPSISLMWPSFAISGDSISSSTHACVY